MQGLCVHVSLLGLWVDVALAAGYQYCHPRGSIIVPGEAMPCSTLTSGKSYQACVGLMSGEWPFSYESVVTVASAI